MKIKKNTVARNRLALAILQLIRQKSLYGGLMHEWNKGYASAMLVVLPLSEVSTAQYTRINEAIQDC